MKILVVLPDDVRYGGTCCFLERLMEIHSRQGIVSMLLVPEDLCYPVLVSLVKRYGIELVLSPNRTNYLTTPFLTPLFDFYFSWSTVRSWKPDLVVVSTSGPGRMSIALYYPVPVLYILHSVPEYRFRFLPRCYLRLGMMFNNMVMTVSRSAAELISSVMGLPKEKIAVVHNSCHRAELSADTRQPVVLTIGHVVSYKNPTGWLDVARMVLHVRPDVLFIWLGDGELYDLMRSHVSELGLDACITFPGYVADPSTWYKSAQVYFQPSLRESHGIAVIEAMAHGLPCVVSDTGGLPESVADGESGYVCPPTDVNGFSTRIIELLDDPELRNVLGNSGRMRAEKCFSEELQERKIMSIYERLMNRSGK